MCLCKLLGAAWWKDYHDKTQSLLRDVRLTGQLLPGGGMVTAPYLSLGLLTNIPFSQLCLLQSCRVDHPA